MVKLAINEIGFNCENTHKIDGERLWGKFIRKIYGIFY
jgi:hypothetical protein